MLLKFFVKMFIGIVVFLGVNMVIVVNLFIFDMSEMKSRSFLDF